MSVEHLDNGTEQWYALQVKARYEKTVAFMARSKGFEEFLPLYRSRRRWSDRQTVLELPLFPGYLFCRLNPHHRLPLLTIPGVIQFVGIGKTPVAIGASEIEALQGVVRSGLAAEPWPFLRIGQRVRIDDGPLAGAEGILAGHAKQERLVVSVSLLQRSVAITIERGWAVPIDEYGKQVTGLSHQLLAVS